MVRQTPTTVLIIMLGSLESPRKVNMRILSRIN